MDEPRSSCGVGMGVTHVIPIPRREASAFGAGFSWVDGIPVWLAHRQEESEDRPPIPPMQPGRSDRPGCQDGSPTGEAAGVEPAASPLATGDHGNAWTIYSSRIPRRELRARALSSPLGQGGRLDSSPTGECGGLTSAFSQGTGPLYPPRSQHRCHLMSNPKYQYQPSLGIP